MTDEYVEIKAHRFAEMLEIIRSLRAERDRLAEAAKALADKVDATSDCDHKRQSCDDIGCIGAQVKAVRAALAKEPTDEQA